MGGKNGKIMKGKRSTRKESGIKKEGLPLSGALFEPWLHRGPAKFLQVYRPEGARLCQSATRAHIRTAGL